MTELESIRLKDRIAEVPDFPKPGINFKDITPIFEDPNTFSMVVEELSEQAEKLAVDCIVAIDARGFLLGSPMALKNKVPLVLARKPGKLPRQAIREEYDLEYGSAALEITENSIQAGQRVFIVDDLLATGGTAASAAKIVERMGAVVAGFGFIIELDFLNARQRLQNTSVYSLIHY